MGNIGVVDFQFETPSPQSFTQRTNNNKGVKRQSNGPTTG